MKLHANARLSLKGRELLVERVEGAGWSLTQAPRRPESVTAPRASGWGATGPRGRRGCWIVPGAGRGRQSHR
jgi:hypothetical protein